MRWVEDAGVEHHRERHDGSAGAFGSCGALIEIGFIGDPDHAIECGAPLVRCPLAIRENIGEADPAMTAGLFEGNFTRLEELHDRGTADAQRSAAS